jgi:hypothetical protein
MEWLRDYWMAFRVWLSPTWFSQYVENYPTTCLKHKHICKLLKDSQFDYCVLQAPSTALACYSHHVDARLSAKQFDYCVKDQSWYALAYPDVCKHLNDFQFNYCLWRHPQLALEYKHVCDRVSDIQFDESFKMYPLLTIRTFILKRANPYQKSFLRTC